MTTTDVRHDCRFCSHSNDSHDPIVGCLYPNCMCANKSPALDAARWQLNRPRKGRQGRPWAILRWFLGSVAAAILAALVLAGAFLVALVVLVARGS